MSDPRKRQRPKLILPPPIRIGAARRWRQETICEWARQREQEALARREAQAVGREGPVG